MSETLRRLRGQPRAAPAHPWLAQIASSHPRLRHEALVASGARDATTAITVRDDDVVRAPEVVPAR